LECQCISTKASMVITSSEANKNLMQANSKLQLKFRMLTKMVYLSIHLLLTSTEDLSQLQLQQWNKVHSITNHGLQVLTVTHRCQKLLLRNHHGMSNNLEVPNKLSTSKNKLMLQNLPAHGVSMVTILICHHSLMMEVLFKLMILLNHHMILSTSISQTNKSLERK